MIALTTWVRDVGFARSFARTSSLVPSVIVGMIVNPEFLMVAKKYMTDCAKRQKKSEMKKLTPFFALIVLLSSMVAISQEANAAAQPRKVLSGWIPYYSMNRSLPAVVANADIIREVMPFWYTLKFNGAKKLPVVTDLYAPANPSVPIAIPLATMRNSGFTIIPTITDGTSELVLAKLLATVFHLEPLFQLEQGDY